MRISTVCSKGHPWTEASTIQREGRGRECRICARERATEWARKKREKERAKRPPQPPTPRPKCSIKGCPKDSDSRGWCNVHYQQWRRYGDPLARKRIHNDDVSRFWSKVDKNGPVPEHDPELGPCWLWLDKPGKHGYAQIRIGGRSGKFILVHRWSYEHLVGEIPEGLQLDHLCHSNFSRCQGGDDCIHRRCVNPAHLHPTTGRLNTLRARTAPAANAVKTHCKHGHPFDEANTRWYRGHRYCRECGRQALRAYRAAKKAQTAG